MQRSYFYPRPPCGGRRFNARGLAGQAHFYPRPPCGGRHQQRAYREANREFLSTSPLRGTTVEGRPESGGSFKFLSTSPLRGTKNSCIVKCSRIIISIHVPLAGDDRPRCCPAPRRGWISIHVPLAGDDAVRSKRSVRLWDFYPRPPCGGRLEVVAGLLLPDNFYPRPPCGGRLVRRLCAKKPFVISIHVPLAGDDGRHSRRRAYLQRISIHVPLAGDDPSALRVCGGCGIYFYPRPPCGGRHLPQSRPRRAANFYPRPPCGGRHNALYHRLDCVPFLSTSPLRGTTGKIGGRGFVRPISIHVPLAGDDMRQRMTLSMPADFYPRPPCGGRRVLRASGDVCEYFYPRPPCGGRRITPVLLCALRCISIHVPLAGDDGKLRAAAKRTKEFLSTSPLRGTTSTRAAARAETLRISIHVPLAGDDAELAGLIWSEQCISIHVPLAGDDDFTADDWRAAQNFYPRPPCGGRPQALLGVVAEINFYPRPPCGGRLHGIGRVQVRVQFLSTSPLRGTTGGAEMPKKEKVFLSTSPLRGTTHSAQK